MDRRDRAVRRLRLRHPRVQLRTLRGAQERDRLGLPRVESQGGWLRQLWLRHGRTRRPAAPRNYDRASTRADSLIGPHPCRHLVGSLPRRRCRRRTDRVGGACRDADRRSLVVDRSLEGGARQRVLTAIARRRLSFPRYFQRNSNDPCPIYLTASATGASDHAPYPWPDERPHHTFDEPERPQETLPLALPIVARLVDHDPGRHVLERTVILVQRVAQQLVGLILAQIRMTVLLVDRHRRAAKDDPVPELVEDLGQARRHRFPVPALVEAEADVARPQLRRVLDKPHCTKQ